jgi:hypothetical protein
MKNHSNMKRIASIILIAMFPWQLFAAQFTLTWTDNSTNETGFTVERAPGLNATTGWLVLNNVGANVTSYVDAGLPNETSYSYRLCAYNTAGKSGYSNTASGTTPPNLPSTPSAPALEGDAPYVPPAPNAPVVTLQAGQSITVAAAP